MGWDVHSEELWAKSLGMARTSLFGARHRESANDRATVFVDGRSASFALCMSDTSDAVLGAQSISWAWSSYLRHTLILTGTSTELFLKSWDHPHDATKLRVPRSAAEADDLIARISRLRPPRTEDVVGRMMDVFKRLRAAMSSSRATNVHVVRAFNLLIELTEQTGVESVRDLESLGNLLEQVESHDHSLDEFSKTFIGDAVEAMVQSAPSGLNPINTNLLIRHASGSLYQEAHFELERQAYIQQTLFYGNEPNLTKKGVLPRDARFTPPELARTLVEQCLAHSRLDIGSIRVLDPACGSGVFLQECLRELDSRGFAGHVALRGFDSSPISVELSRFCVGHAKDDLLHPLLTASVAIEETNALSEDADWGEPEFILMNPPFAAYKDMSAEDRQLCRTTLGDLTKGHFDKAMAFIWKAISKVTPGGFVASVLPSSLLESVDGRKWRAAITDLADLRTVGQFKGYSYFRDAMVEPAFIVMQKKTTSDSAPPRLTILEAEENAEDVAMRTLRKGIEANGDDIFLARNCPPPAPSVGWMPRGFRHQGLLAALATSSSTVGELFDVRQGVLTGNNDAFLLNADEFYSLPEEERPFFHPAAGTSTIWDGRLSCRQFVFYPHGVAQAALQTERDVSAQLPVYFNKWLEPARKQLMGRRDKHEGNWWTLTEYRAWQADFPPQLLTAYFGTSGKFTFDHEGKFVCVQGYSWQWRRSESVAVQDSSDDTEGEAPDFYDSPSPLAYVAVMNCPLFDVLLESYCPRVQGGQFNLSKRFVRSVPLPDFMSGSVPGELTLELAAVGKRFLLAESIDKSALASLTARAYGVPLSRWDAARYTRES